MRLKILLVPLLLVLGMVIIIGWIEPAYKEIGNQQDIRAKKEARVAQMQAVLANANSMNATLDNRSQDEQFILKYMPKDLDQGRTADALNFLAVQSGLQITSMQMREVVRDVSPVVAAAATEMNPLGTPDATTDPDVPMVEVMPDPETYTATFTVHGGYENIRAFLERMLRSDRIADASNFVIQPAKETGKFSIEDSSVTSTNDLTATITASFSYVPAKKVGSAMNIATFQKSDFDFGPIDRAHERISSPVPPLETPGTGKPNPFQ